MERREGRQQQQQQQRQREGTERASERAIYIYIARERASETRTDLGESQVL